MREEDYVGSSYCIFGDRATVSKTSVLGEEAPENTTFALVWKQM